MNFRADLPRQSTSNLNPLRSLGGKKMTIADRQAKHIHYEFLLCSESK